jgi:hypothetical protein
MKWKIKFMFETTNQMLFLMITSFVALTIPPTQQSLEKNHGHLLGWLSCSVGEMLSV